MRTGLSEVQKGRGMKVLLAGDDIGGDVRFKEVLEEEGCRVVACARASEVPALCENGGYPLVVVDMDCPSTGGVEVCRRVRRLETGRKCFVLGLTASACPCRVREFLAAGVDDLLAKPVQREQLRLRLILVENRPLAPLAKESHPPGEESAEEKPVQGDARACALINATTDVLGLIDRQGRHLLLNQAAADSLGRPVEELLGARAFDLFPPSVAENRKRMAEKVIRSRQPVRFQDRREGKDFDVSFYPVLDARGRVEQIAFYARNVTEQKRMEKALKRSEARYRAIVEDQRELICRYKPDGTLTFANSAYCRYFGKAREEMIGKNFFAFLPEEDRAVMRGVVSRLNADNPVLVTEHRVASPEGEVQWTQWLDRVLCDEEGRAVEYQGVGHDITRLKETEEELKRLNDRLAFLNAGLEQRVEERTRELHEEQERLRDISDSFPGCIYQFLMTSDGRMSLPYISAGVKEVFGRTADELKEEVRRDLPGVLEEDRRGVVEAIGESRERLTPFWAEYRYRHGGGGVRWLRSMSVPRRLEDGSVLWNGVALDVTSFKRVEEDLLESEALHRAILESIAELIFITDDQGRFVYMSPAVESVCGHTREEVLRKGSVYAVFGDRFYPARKVREHGEVIDAEVGVFDARGRERLLLVNAKRASIKGGTVLYSCHDVTERKRAERELANIQAQLVHSSRLTALGEMAAAMAHELNQPLQIIQTAAETVALELEGRGEIQREISPLAESIQEEVERAAAIIVNVRQFARRDEAGDFCAVDLRESVEAALGFFRAQFKARGIRLRESLEGGLPFSSLNPGNFQQVLVNLLANARYAVEKKAPECHPAGTKCVDVRLYRSEGASVVLEVEDNGVGMDGEEQLKCFDPFFTTKPPGEGAGMGLSIVHGIVRHFKGKVEVRSRKGKGSLFRVLVPFVGKK